MHTEYVSVLAGVLVGGVVAQWLGWRLRVPAIVFLLAGGLLAGPVTGVLDPDKTFGDLLFPAVSIAVAVILFEGALGLGWRGVRAAGSTVWTLLTVGAAITMAGTAFAARYVLDVEWNMALLLAAVLVVTGPTVVGPIVRAIGLHGKLASILEAEGTLIDPIGAILTVLVFQASFEAHEGDGSIVVKILATVGVGAGIGLVAAILLLVGLAFYLIPDQLHVVTTLALVIGAFALSNALREESGLVAVTVMGIALASQQRVAVHHVLEFNETLRILFISGLFVLLGARLDAATLREVEWRNIVFLILLVVLVRPLCVAVSTIGSTLSLREKLFLAATAPRGIVAAAIASVFALRLADRGVDNSQILVSATFTVIGGTVLLSGLGSKFLAARLGLVDDEDRPIIILGSSPVARAIAASLEHNGAAVRIVDLDRRQLSAARMDGLAAHHGSVFTDRTWEAAGIEKASQFLAMTSNDELNIIASRHAAGVIGRKHVFQLPPSRPADGTWLDMRSGSFARPLFSKETNFSHLAELLDGGWKVTSTQLTEKFGPDDHARVHPEAIPLFVVDTKDHIHILAADSNRRFRVGETVVTLAKPVVRTQAAQAE